MLSADIVATLTQRLPVFTDLFSDEVSITSLTSTATTATAVTSTPHSLTIGQGVAVVGSLTPIVITSFTRTLTTGTITTASDHDATFGSVAIPASVLTSGAVEAAFNGTFPLLSVPNRRTLIVRMPDSGATTATGSPIAENVSSALAQYNGLFSVTAVPDTTTFEYTILNGPFPDATGNPVARLNIKVSDAVSFERAVAAYTAQPSGDLWAFVVMGDNLASKNRTILSDAVDDQQRSQQGVGFRQQTIQSVAIYVFFPVSAQVSAARSRDEAQILRRTICQAILFQRFDTNLFVGKYNSLQFVSHGFFAYNTSVYVNQYSFEAVEPLQFEDSVGYSEDVAFRDISLAMTLRIGDTEGTGQLTAEIDLDDEPIPPP